jgi:protein gp37
MMQAARWADLRGTDRPDKPWLNGFPRMIFVGDMGDFASKAVQAQYIVDEIIGAIRSPQGQRHFWLLLTKQIRRLAEISHLIGGLPDNCMAMTTVTSQHTANIRVRDLLRVKSKWKGISAEPLLESVELDDLVIKDGRPGEWRVNCLDAEGIDPKDDIEFNGATVNWVICGGESDQKEHPARPSHPDWFRTMRDACVAANVPFFFKQNGAYLPACDVDICHPAMGRPPAAEFDEVRFVHVGKAYAGRLLDGHQWNQMPQLLN